MWYDKVKTFLFYEKIKIILVNLLFGTIIMILLGVNRVFSFNKIMIFLASSALQLILIFKSIHGVIDFLKKGIFCF